MAPSLLAGLVPLAVRRTWLPSAASGAQALARPRKSLARFTACSADQGNAGGDSFHERLRTQSTCGGHIEFARSSDHYVQFESLAFTIISFRAFPLHWLFIGSFRRVSRSRSLCRDSTVRRSSVMRYGDTRLEYQLCMTP